MEPLVGFMRDDLTGRGQRAWWTLMRIGAPAEGPVLECLVSSPTPAARVAAAWVLGHIGSVAMQPGDVFVIETPGGGGYGTPA